MIDLLLLVALYTATTVGLIALGYWWGYGNGQTDGYDAGQIDGFNEYQDEANASPIFRD